MNRLGVVSCGCEVPVYGEAVGFTDYGPRPAIRGRSGRLYAARRLEMACARCGWKGSPTFWRGRLLLECPGCEGWGGESYPEPPAGTHWVIRPPRVRAVVSRNALCPCGSGLKAKRCHPEVC